jgi:hypothetical protein
MKKFFVLICALFSLSVNAASVLLETPGMTVKLTWEAVPFHEGVPHSGYAEATGLRAQPFVIDVWTEAGAGVPSSPNRIQVVLNTLCRSSFSGALPVETFKADLAYQGENHYTGAFDGNVMIRKTSAYESFSCRQTLAAVKEGVWFKDPGTGNDFELQLN